MVEALLMLLPSSLFSNLVVLYRSRGGRQKARETVLRINSKGD
jgi:hypothetical protein